jgi:hypothetical protein
MLNLGNINFNDLTPVNTVLKLVAPSQAGINSIGPSSLTDDGATVTSTKKVVAPAIQTTTVYSAAGTPLPAASTALKGTRAMVSDATTPTFLGAYVSGGAVFAPVICDGTDWLTA